MVKAKKEEDKKKENNKVSQMKVTFLHSCSLFRLWVALILEILITSEISNILQESSI